MRVHFIAIGGSAMHNLALALHKKGDQVTGSDDLFFDPSKSRLAAKNLLPEKEGWDANKITKDLDAVILGMHARADNPELLRAKELGLPIFSYPEYLYEQSKEKNRIVIGGSHGKTSITAMILHVLEYLKRDVDYMVGAQLPGFDTMVKISDAKDMVLEGDEYLSSPIDLRPKFLLYKGNVAVLNGIAWDHINVFPTEDDYVKQFDLFLDSLEDGARVFYYEGDPLVQKVIARTNHDRIISIPYGVFPHELREDGVYLFLEDTYTKTEIFGKHNFQNLSAAYSVCRNMGVSNEDFLKAIRSFKGAARRLELLEENKNLKIFNDFAHAPSKLIATIQAVKDTYPNKKLVAVMELHTFSSMNPVFLKGYKDCMNAADEAIVFYDPKAAEHKKLKVMPSEEIEKAFHHPNLSLISNGELLKKTLWNKEWKDANLLLMSSGNFGGLVIKDLAKELIEKTSKN